MKKSTVLFRCPKKYCREIEKVCSANEIDMTRFILSALLLYVDACEQERIFSVGGAEDPHPVNREQAGMLS